MYLETLKSECKIFVGSEGPSDPSYAFIGEQPGQMEVLAKKPFVGPSGRLLKACIMQSGLNAQDCYFTNCIKSMDLPLENYVTAPKSRRQSPAWLPPSNAHLKALWEEVLALPPTTPLIAVGNVALAALTGRWGILKWRGSLLKSLQGDRHVIPIIHPSACIKGSSEFSHLVVTDLKKVKYYVERNFELKKRDTLTQPTYAEAMQFLELCYSKGMEGQPIAFDIEIKHLELNCFSLAFSPSVGMSIPLEGPKGAYFTPPQEMEILKALAKILTSTTIKKVGQNIIFDSHFMLRKFGIRTTNFDDTMVAHHTLLPQLPKGLDMITSLYTDVPYYKDEGKEWFAGGGTYNQLWVYNALDSLTCLEALPKIVNGLERQQNTLAYERQLSIVAPCCYMMERGIRVDKKGIEVARERMEADIKRWRQQLEEIAPGLNPQSPKQLQEYFYGRLGIKPMKNKQHKISVDADALKRIARRYGSPGANEAKLISQIKKQEKLLSTYLADIKFDTDDRIRCSYNPCGTTYSRLSSSKSIFGSGMNMQNWPHAMLEYLLPDEGYVYYGVDLSQAENRIVAYVGRIEQMIDAFETGKDVHRLTASLIFKKPMEEISDELGSCSLGNGEESERHWGKKANHGLNYDLGYKSFALYYDIPEKDAKFIVDSYHAAYPELRKNFHGYVKESLKKTHTLTNLMGRKTLFLTDLSDDTYKAAYSCIPQGTVGDIINERGMAFLYYNPMFKHVELLQQVHDSIGFQVPLSLSWYEHALILQALKDSLETPITTHYGRSFVIPADVVMGKSLMKEKGIEFKSKKWPSTVEELAQKLEAGWASLQEEN